MSEPASASRRPRGWAIVVYSLLRLVLLLAVWVVVELTTPFHGLWALAIGLLISGAISVLVLDRQRDAVSLVVASVFGRINARIDAASRAEDYDEPVGSGESDQHAEGDSVGKQ